MMFHTKLALLIGASILSCASNLFFVSTARAQEAKTGTAIFDGHIFQFEIIDRGVRTSGQIYPKPAILTSEHNYVLTYNPKNEMSREQLLKLADAMRADGAAKCQGLSDTEFSAFQKSDASDAVKKSAGQLAEFNGSSSAQRALDPALNPGVFICNTIIKVQIN